MIKHLGEPYKKYHDTTRNETKSQTRNEEKLFGYC